MVWYLLEQWHKENLMHQNNTRTIKDQLFWRRFPLFRFFGLPLLINRCKSCSGWMVGLQSLCLKTFLIRLYLHDYNIFCPPAPSLQLICAPLVGDQGLGAITLSRGCLAFTSGIIAVWFDGFHENMILCFCHLTKTLFIEIKLNCKMIWNRLCDTEHFPWSNACNPGRDGLNNWYTKTSDYLIWINVFVRCTPMCNARLNAWLDRRVSTSL